MPEVIGTEREFMESLRTLRVRSGLSYRDVALRMSRAAPRHAMAKSTLAALFAGDALPRRPGQLTAIVDVLAGELAEPADVSARYLEAWTRLMTARSARPGTAVPSPPAPVYYQHAYRKACVPCTPPEEVKSDYEQAGGLWPLLAVGTVLSVLTWLMFMHSPLSFWDIWLMWCGPVLVIAGIAALFGPRAGSRQDQLPAEYVRYEQRTTPRWPSLY